MWFLFCLVITWVQQEGKVSSESCCWQRGVTKTPAAVGDLVQSTNVHWAKMKVGKGQGNSSLAETICKGSSIFGWILYCLNKLCDNHQAGVLYSCVPQWNLQVHCRDQVHRNYNIVWLFFHCYLSVLLIACSVWLQLAAVLWLLPKLGEDATASATAATALMCSSSPQQLKSDASSEVLQSLSLH